VKPIVVHIKTREAYEWDGEKFTNLRTLKSGVVDDEKAREIFKFNVEASQIFHDYPIVKSLLNKLNMKLIKDE
jgi:ribosomal silencing factor RsfS